MRLTEFQRTILIQASRNGGRFVNGRLLIGLRPLEARGLILVEDNGSMRGRGMNTERWLIITTPAGRAEVARVLIERRVEGEALWEPACPDPLSRDEAEHALCILPRRTDRNLSIEYRLTEASP